MIVLTILSLPFMLREPIDLPPIVSVELIQISDKTNIPYAPKARKIIEDTKKKEEENECDEGDEEGEEEEPKEHDEEVEEEIPELKVSNRVKDAQMNNTGGLGLCIAIVTSVAIAIQSLVRTYLHKDNTAKNQAQLKKELDAKIEKWKDDKTVSFTKDEYRSPEKKQITVVPLGAMPDMALPPRVSTHC